MRSAIANKPASGESRVNDLVNVAAVYPLGLARNALLVNPRRSEIARLPVLSTPARISTR